MISFARRTCVADAFVDTQDARDPDIFMSLALACKRQPAAAAADIDMHRRSDSAIVCSYVARPIGGRGVDVLQAQRRASDGDRGTIKIVCRYLVRACKRRECRFTGACIGTCACVSVCVYACANVHVYELVCVGLTAMCSAKHVHAHVLTFVSEFVCACERECTCVRDYVR